MRYFESQGSIAVKSKTSQCDECDGVISSSSSQDEDEDRGCGNSGRKATVSNVSMLVLLKLSALIGAARSIIEAFETFFQASVPY